MNKRQKRLKKAYNIRRNNIAKDDLVKGVTVTSVNAERFSKYFNAVYGN